MAPVYSMESPDGTRLFYEAESLDAIVLAASCIHEDFPGEEFVVMKAGEYDPTATLMVQEGMAS